MRFSVKNFYKTKASKPEAFFVGKGGDKYMPETEAIITWQQLMETAKNNRSGVVIDETKLTQISGIPEILAKPVSNRSHRLIVDRTGRPTLQSR